jgi:hypothetical protein
MGKQKTSLETLSRVEAPNHPEIREARVVKHSSGRIAEVCRLANDVITIRPVPREDLRKVMGNLCRFEVSTKRAG